jgi:hypothetical protein
MREMFLARAHWVLSGGFTGRGDEIIPRFDLNQLPVWAPDAAIRKKILVDNPARLYRF